MYVKISAKTPTTIITIPTILSIIV